MNIDTIDIAGSSNIESNIDDIVDDIDIAGASNIVDDINNKLDDSNHNYKNNMFSITNLLKEEYGDKLIIFSNLCDLFQNTFIKNISCHKCKKVCKIHCIWCSKQNCITHNINRISIQPKCQKKKRSYYEISINYLPSMPIFITGNLTIAMNPNSLYNQKVMCFIEIISHTELLGLFTILDQLIVNAPYITEENNIKKTYKEWTQDRSMQPVNKSFSKSKQPQINYLPILYINCSYSNTQSIAISLSKLDNNELTTKLYTFDLYYFMMIFPELDNDIATLFNKEINASLLPYKINMTKSVENQLEFKVAFHVKLYLKFSQDDLINKNRPDAPYKKNINIEECLNNIKKMIDCYIASTIDDKKK